MIVINNRDYNIDQNNRDYDFGHNRAALFSMCFYIMFRCRDTLTLGFVSTLGADDSIQTNTPAFVTVLFSCQYQ